MYHLESMQGTKAERVRIPQYDLMRVTAMFLVVYVHSSFMFTFTLDSDSTQAGLYWFTSMLALVCNALFFMVSGKFNLAQAVELKSGEYRAFYIKKAIDLLVPIIFYAIAFWVLRFLGIWLFGAYTDGTPFWDFGAFITMFQELLVSSWWFVPMIFSLMIFTPFLGRMLKGLKQKEMYLLLVLIFGCAAIVAIEKVIGNTTFLSKFLAPTFGIWAGAYMLGYVIDRADMTAKVLSRWYIAAAAVITIFGSLFVIIPQVLITPDGSLVGGWNNVLSALFYPVIAGALFLFFKNVKITNDKAKRFVEFVGNRAFGIYLIHFCFFFSYLQLLPDWLRNADDVVSGVAKRLVITTLVYLASLAVAIVIDLFIVNPVQKKLKGFFLKKREYKKFNFSAYLGIRK